MSAMASHILEGSVGFDGKWKLIKASFESSQSASSIKRPYYSGTTVPFVFCLLFVSKKERWQEREIDS